VKEGGEGDRHGNGEFIILVLAEEGEGSTVCDAELEDAGGVGVGPDFKTDFGREEREEGELGEGSHV